MTRYTTLRNPTHKRFMVFGGAGGYIAIRRVRRSTPIELADMQQRGFRLLFKVNRPCEGPLREAALDAVFRCYALRP